MIEKITDLQTGKTYEVDPHQITAYKHLEAHPRAALFLGMSLSKTVITLSYLYDMTYKEAAFSRTLVIAPDKVARLTWPDELKKWAHLEGVRYSVISGDAKKRKAALETPAELYIIGVDSLVWLIDNCRGVLPFDSIVIDELSLFKSRSSNRFKKLRKAIRPIAYRIGLTGTPSPNGYIDLWAQMVLIDDGERLGPTFGKYVDKYFTTHGNGMIVYEYRPRPGAPEQIAKKISDVALSMQTREYLTQPDLITDDVILEFNDFDREVYDTLEAEYVLDFLEGEDVTVKTAADLTQKLLQITSGAIYEDQVEGKARQWHEVNTLKLEALAELLEAHPDENFIVVYQFKHEIDRIKKRFAFARELRKGAKTEEDFNAWNNKEIRLLLIHPASAGHGLNLQFGGRRMVWYSLTWNLEHYAQTVARLLRRGALKEIYIHRLIVKGTRDPKVAAALTTKDTNQNFLLNEIKTLKAKYYGKVRQ